MHRRLRRPSLDMSKPSQPMLGKFLLNWCKSVSQNINSMHDLIFKKRKVDSWGRTSPKGILNLPGRRKGPCPGHAYSTCNSEDYWISRNHRILLNQLESAGFSTSRNLGEGPFSFWWDQGFEPWSAGTTTGYTATALFMRSHIWKIQYTMHLGPLMMVTCDQT